MKLFKKLAAVALAAVLALAMVGCGSSASLKDELLKVAMDQMTMNGRTANHSKELDELAAKLVAEADKAAAKAGNTDKPVLDLLTDEEVVKAAGIDAAKETYRVSAAENYKLLSSTANKEKAMVLALELISRDSEQIGGGVLDPSSYGFAVGKINGKEYFVMLMNGPSRF